MARRWICRIVRHQYIAERLPDSGDDGGFVLRCRRCGHERQARQGEPAHWAAGGGIG
jgi:hypothetical protein